MKCSQTYSGHSPTVTAIDSIVSPVRFDGSSVLGSQFSVPSSRFFALAL